MRALTRAMNNATCSSDYGANRLVCKPQSRIMRAQVKSTYVLEAGVRHALGLARGLVRVFVIWLAAGRQAIRRRVVPLFIVKSCARKRWPGRRDNTKHCHVGP